MADVGGAADAAAGMHGEVALGRFGGGVEAGAELDAGASGRGMGIVAAELNLYDVGGGLDDALAVEEAVNKLFVMPRCAHGDDEFFFDWAVVALVG